MGYRASTLFKSFTAIFVTLEPAQVIQYLFHWIAKDMHIPLNSAERKCPFFFPYMNDDRVAEGHSLNGMTSLETF